MLWKVRRKERDRSAMTDDDVNECIAALLEATSGGAVRFHAAAGGVRSEEARTLLLDRAWRVGQAAAALRTLAAERGTLDVIHEAGRPAPEIGPADDESILGECERREAGIIVAYRDALECPLPAPVRAVVAREFERMLTSLGTLRVARERAARQRRPLVGRAL
jgi:hypothetical protein